MEIVDILSFSRSHEKAGVISARLNIIHTCTHTYAKRYSNLYDPVQYVTYS